MLCPTAMLTPWHASGSGSGPTGSGSGAGAGSTLGGAAASSLTWPSVGSELGLESPCRFAYGSPPAWEPSTASCPGGSNESADVDVSPSAGSMLVPAVIAAAADVIPVVRARRTAPTMAAASEHWSIRNIRGLTTECGKAEREGSICGCYRAWDGKL